MSENIQNIATTGILNYGSNITAPLVNNVKGTEEELVGAAQNKLSQEQCDKINATRRARLQEIANKFVQDVMKVTAVDPNDSPEMMQDKGAVFHKITLWVDAFKNVVFNVIDRCVQMIKQKVENAATKVKNFFWDIYKSIT